MVGLKKYIIAEIEAKTMAVIAVLGTFDTKGQPDRWTSNSRRDRFECL
jgi:hypothetical protein